MISLSRRLSGLVIVLKLEASILPKPIHNSRERYPAGFQTVFYLGSSRLLAPRKTMQERLRDGKLCEWSQFGDRGAAAGFL